MCRYSVTVARLGALLAGAPLLCLDAIDATQDVAHLALSRRWLATHPLPSPKRDSKAAPSRVGHSWPLRAAFDELPRRSRVIVVLRLGFAAHRPLTLRAIGELLGGHERVRQLEHHAVWMLVRAWRPQSSPADLSSDEGIGLLAPIVDAAIERHPLDGDPAAGAS